MEFPRQEYWSGLPSLSLGDLPNPRSEPTSLTLAGGFLTTEPPIQFSSVQFSHSVMSNSATPWTAARQAKLYKYNKPPKHLFFPPWVNSICYRLCFRHCATKIPAPLSLPSRNLLFSERNRHGVKPHEKSEKDLKNRAVRAASQSRGPLRMLVPQMDKAWESFQAEQTALISSICKSQMEGFS